MSKDTAGILMVIFGIFTLISQLFVDLNKPPKPGDWPDKKKYKRALIMAGIGFIILGIIMLLLNEP